MAFYSFCLTVFAILATFLGCQTTPPLETAQWEAFCRERDPANVSCRRAVDPTPLQPVERLESKLSDLQSSIKSTLKDTVEFLGTENTRRTTLLLQALGKIYEAEAPSKSVKSSVKEFRKEIQSLENAIGSYMRFTELAKRLKNIEVPNEIRGALDKKIVESQKEFQSYLKRESWWPKSKEKFSYLEKLLEEFEIQKPKKDHKVQLRAVLELIEESEANIKTQKKFIKKETYSYDDLEGGLHSFRRDLRWITLALQASEGTFVYSNKSPASKEYVELNLKYGNSKYSGFAKPSKRATEIDPLPMLRLVRFIDVLGKLKDFKESQIDLAEVIVSSGYEKNPEKAMELSYEIISQKMGEVNVESSAKQYYQEFIEQNPLQGIRENIERDLN